MASQLVYHIEYYEGQIFDGAIVLYDKTTPTDFNSCVLLIEYANASLDLDEVATIDFSILDADPDLYLSPDVFVDYPNVPPSDYEFYSFDEDHNPCHEVPEGVCTCHHCTRNLYQSSVVTVAITEAIKVTLRRYTPEHWRAEFAYSGVMLAEYDYIGQVSQVKYWNSYLGRDALSGALTPKEVYKFAYSQVRLWYRDYGKDYYVESEA